MFTDVTFNRLGRQTHPVRDRLVRTSLRHQTEHLTFPLRPTVERVVPTGSSDQPGHHLAVDHRPPGADPADRVGELLDVEGAVPSTDTRASRPRRRPAPWRHRSRRTATASGRRHPAARPGWVGGLETLVGERGRHPDVHDGHVGRIAPHLGQQIIGAASPLTTVNPDSVSRRAIPSRRSTELSASATRIAWGTVVDPASFAIGSSLPVTRTMGTGSRSPFNRTAPRSL